MTGDFVQLTDTLYKTNSDTSYYGLLTTGASEDSKKMNIYDFAGNEREWTLERTTSSIESSCATRAGGFYSDGSDYTASNRYGED